MLKLIDPDTTIKFIPSCEKDSDNPTTFFIKPETMRAKLKRQRLFSYNAETKQVDFTDDDKWLDYIAARIADIKNLYDPQPPNLAIRSILEELPASVGSELFSFIMENTDLGEAKVKN